MTKVIHLCCGYPLYLDQTDYLKADPMAYHKMAEKLDESGFDRSKSHKLMLTTTTFLDLVNMVDLLVFVS